MSPKLQVGIIGLGKFGFRFGKTLVQLGHDVVGIDVNPDHIRRAQQVFTQVYQADAMDKKALEQIGFREMTHALVSVGESIEASTMISMYLKELGVSQVWVKGVNTDHEKLLRKIGVDEVIIPEHMAAKDFANRLAIPGFIEYLPFDQNVALKQLVVDKWAGKTLRQIDLTNTYSIQVVAVKKTGEPRFRYIPKADDPLEKEDTLVVIGTTERLALIKP
jgi:trk system potassium uptake protein TrkA